MKIMPATTDDAIRRLRRNLIETVNFKNRRSPKSSHGPYLLLHISRFRMPTFRMLKPSTNTIVTDKFRGITRPIRPTESTVASGIRTISEHVTISEPPTTTESKATTQVASVYSYKTFAAIYTEHTHVSALLSLLALHVTSDAYPTETEATKSPSSNDSSDTNRSIIYALPSYRRSRASSIAGNEVNTGEHGYASDTQTETSPTRTTTSNP